jgi:hypothetical protein
MAKAKLSRKSELKPADSNLTLPAVSGGSNGLAATEAKIPVPELKKAETPSTETIEPVRSASMKNSKKTSVVRTDARATLVPVNLDEEIRRLAYMLSERRGFEPGHETEDWLSAEHEIRERYHQPSA